MALTRPEQVGSLLLSAPGGSLIAEATPDVREFFEAERSALAGDDLDGAVEANLAWWVDGPKRDIGDVDPAVRELRVPTLVLVGLLDLDAILDTARRVTAGLPNARRVDWADTAHLPSMERPDDFVALLRNWLAA